MCMHFCLPIYRIVVRREHMRREILTTTTVATIVTITSNKNYNKNKNIKISIQT